MNGQQGLKAIKQERPLGLPNLTTSPRWSEAINQVYNVAVNARTDLNELFEMLRSRLVGGCAHLADFKPVYQDFRAGDVLHSQADISKAARLVGYMPTYLIAAGLDEALAWYVESVKA